MAKPAKQVQQMNQGRSLWGRMLGRAPAKASERHAPPLVAPVRHRALTAKDALYRVDDATGQRVYVPLTVEGAPGKWAGRCWCHCGDLDGVLLVAWHERDDLGAVMRWRTLAEGDVQMVEGSAA